MNQSSPPALQDPVPFFFPDEAEHIAMRIKVDDDTAACLSSVEVVTKRGQGESNEVEQVTKVKLWDKQAALVNIGRHLGMFKDRIDLTGEIGMRPVELARNED